MPDPTPGAPAPTPTPPADPAPAPKPSGTDPDPKPGNSAFDPSTLSDEDFNKLYEDNRLYRHPRFKSLSERAKKADDLEKAQSEAERKALEEQGKWKELAEKNAADAKASAEKLQQVTVNSKIQSEAAKLGIVDTEAAVILLDRSKITVNEDGTVTGAEDALKALLEAKPYLKGGAPNTPDVGSGSNPSPGQTPEGTKKFKLSQLQDHKFFTENEKDIQAALKAGLVENDLAR